MSAPKTLGTSWRRVASQPKQVPAKAADEREKKLNDKLRKRIKPIRLNNAKTGWKEVFHMTISSLIGIAIGIGLGTMYMNKRKAKKDAEKKDRLT